MKRNKLIVGIGLLLIGVFALYGFATAEMTFVTGWGEYGMGLDQFKYPHGVAVDSSGYVYVADSGISGDSNQRVLKFDGNGNPLFLDLSGVSFNNPRGIAVNSSGYIYVADSNHNHVHAFIPGTGWDTWWNAGSAGSFVNPHGIAVDPSGNVYVADTNNHRILKFNASGNYLNKWGGYGYTAGLFDQPRGIAVDSSGYVYVADTNNHRIQKFNASGNYLNAWGGYGYTAGQFKYPRGIAVDSSGNMYVADTGRYEDNDSNHRIQVYDGITWTTLGGLSSGSGECEFYFPSGIAVDSTNGYVYVADTYNHRIQKFSLSCRDILETLSEEVIALNLQHRIINSLDAKLQNALDALDAANAGQRQDAINKVEAFINAVEAQSGNLIPETDANDLIERANSIIQCLQ